MRGGIAGLFYLGGLHADFITNQLRGVCIACSISLSLLLPLYPPCSKFISKNLKSNQIFVLFPLKAASHPGPRTQLHPEALPSFLYTQHSPPPGSFRTQWTSACPVKHLWECQARGRSKSKPTWGWNQSACPRHQRLLFHDLENRFGFPGSHQGLLRSHSSVSSHSYCVWDKLAYQLQWKVNFCKYIWLHSGHQETL